MIKRLTAMAGFVALALSPRFEDWQQSPEKRGQFITYYAVALVLIWVGLWDGA